MDRGAWRATVHGVARVRQDCARMHTYVTYSVINSPTFSSLEARIGKSEKTL